MHTLKCVLASRREDQTYLKHGVELVRRFQNELQEQKQQLHQRVAEVRCRPLPARAPPCRRPYVYHSMRRATVSASGCAQLTCPS